MAMPKSKGDAGEYTFMLAATDEQRDSAKSYGVFYSTLLEPSEQRGVWNLCVEALKADTDGTPRRVAMYRASWPNSMVQSFGAFLYQCCHRTARMVESHFEAVEREEVARVK